MAGTRRRLWGLLLPLVLASLLKLVMSAATAPAKRRWGESLPHASAAYPPLPDVDEENEKAAGEAIIQLSEALVNIESLSGSEHAMAHALKGWLSKRGWEVVLQPVPAASGHEKEVREVVIKSRGVSILLLLDVLHSALIMCQQAFLSVLTNPSAPSHHRATAGTSTPFVPKKKRLGLHRGMAKAHAFC